MANPHANRNSPVPSLLATPASKRISLPVSQRLSTIVEGPSAQSRPARNNAYSHNIFNMPHRHHPEPPPHGAEKRPPSYSTQGPVDPFQPDKATKFEWFDRLRNRGGWRRILLIFLALVVIAIALGVGLGVGLRRRGQGSDAGGSNSDSSSGQSSGNSTSPAQPFPLGTWTLNTYLTTQNSSCTSNEATWNCPPYSTYSASPASSLAAFSWIINSTSTPPSNESLVAYSTYNPFSSITLPETQLTLVNAGQSDEHYALSLTLPKKVIPRSAITSDGSTAVCFYNTTIFSATLYTRLGPSLETNNTSVAATSSPASTWPFAVTVQQVVSGSDFTPDCYPATGGTVSGPKITSGLSSEGPGSQCLCRYER